MPRMTKTVVRIVNGTKSSVSLQAMDEIFE